jgi:Raf kinase inhibitor-like YbhB/YbcL family protein
MSKPVFRLAAGLLALLLFGAFAACGSDSSSPSPTATAGASPTAGPTAAGSTPSGPTPTEARRITPDANSQLSLTSSAFADNAAIPDKYTCAVDNTLPPLTIAGVPTDTVSLAITMVDLELPGFTHWAIWNIDPSTTTIAEGTPPAGIEGQNGRSQTGFIAPCPVTGTHKYELDLYALNQRLSLDPASSDASDVQLAAQGHIIAQAALTGTYARTTTP